MLKEGWRMTVLHESRHCFVFSVYIDIGNFTYLNNFKELAVHILLGHRKNIRNFSVSASEEASSSSELLPNQQVKVMCSGVQQGEFLLRGEFLHCIQHRATWQASDSVQCLQESGGAGKKKGKIIEIFRMFQKDKTTKQSCVTQCPRGFCKEEGNNQKHCWF